MDRLLALLIVCVGTVAATAAHAGAAAPATIPTATSQPSLQAEQKLVDTLFGDKIAKAHGTAGEDDDLELVQQMLQAASDSSHPKTLRFVLAMRAFAVASGLGSPAARKACDQAIEQADQNGPLKDSQKAQLQMERQARQLALARSQRRPNDQILVAMKDCAEVDIAYALAVLADEGDVGDADKALRDARAFVTGAKLVDVTGYLEDVEKTVQAAKVKQQRLAAATLRLNTARKDKEFQAAVEASKTIAQIYLEFDGDLKRAAKFIKGTDDARTGDVLWALAGLDNPSAIDVKTGLGHLESLSRIAEKLSPAARGQMARTVLQLAQSYLDAKPPADDATKVKLLMVQVQAMLPKPSAWAVHQDLAAAYGGLQAKVDLPQDDSVRLTYDFSGTIQMRDWEVQSGLWEPANMAMIAKIDQSHRSATRCKIMFRADKPFKISYRGGGKQRLSAALEISPWRYSNWNPYHCLEFTISNNGLVFESFYNTEHWNDAKVRLPGDKDYQMEISSDGAGQFLWKINGQTVREFHLRDRLNDLEGSMQLRLEANGSEGNLNLFDDVVIEGSVVPRPDWTPSGRVRHMATSAPSASRPASRPTSRSRS